MPETDATNPDTGVADQAQAESDDIDTEAFDRQEAPEDDAGEPLSEDGQDDGEPEDQPDPADEDTDEVELEGQKYRIPKAVKPLLMMQQDYTKKTQEVAETKRQLAEQAQAWESEKTQQAEAIAALREDYAKVNVLEARHVALAKEAETYRNVDWAALKAQDPDSYEAHRDRQRVIRDTLLDLDEEVKSAKTELETKEAGRLKATREAAAADLAKRQQETGKALAAEIPNWNPETANRIVTFMVSDLGVKAEEIAEATDPRVWKMAHRLMTAEAEVAKLRAAQKQTQTATNHEKAQQAKPASGAKGNAGASARDPATPRGDGLSMDEWMKRRTAQLTKKRA